MKIALLGNEPAAIDEPNTLVVDSDGDIWFIGHGGAILLDREEGGGTVYTAEEMKEIFNNCGPFTKFNGKITLEN